MNFVPLPSSRVTDCRLPIRPFTRTSMLPLAPIALNRSVLVTMLKTVLSIFLFLVFGYRCRSKYSIDTSGRRQYHFPIFLKTALMSQLIHQTIVFAFQLGDFPFLQFDTVQIFSVTDIRITEVRKIEPADVFDFNRLYRNFATVEHDIRHLTFPFNVLSSLPLYSIDHCQPCQH